MGIFKRFLGGLTSPHQKQYFVYHVKCSRCGEVIEGRVDVDNDLSVEYESGGDVYYCRKVLMGTGENHCYQQIEVGLKFSPARTLIEKRVEGGDFVE